MHWNTDIWFYFVYLSVSTKIAWYKDVFLINTITKGRQVIQFLVSNVAFEAYFVPTSNPAYKCYLFRQLKQRQNKTINEFYICLKEQG